MDREDSRGSAAGTWLMMLAALISVGIMAIPHLF